MAGEIVDLFASEQGTPSAPAGGPDEAVGTPRGETASPPGGKSAKRPSPDRGHKAYRITLEAAPDGSGRLGGARGEADAEGDRFGIEGLGLFEPVDLVLEHGGGPGVLLLEIFKYRFDRPLEQAKATPEQPAIVGLRTQGGLAIRVRAEGAPAVPYRLLVHVGSEEVDRIAPRFSGDEAGSGRPQTSGNRR